MKHSCPNCGYCPHCGRSDRPRPVVYPRPYPWVYPYYGDPPHYYSKTGSGNMNQLGSTTSWSSSSTSNVASLSTGS